MAKPKVAEAYAECKARSASGEFKTFMARAECYNDADRRIAAPLVAGDLLNLRMATRTVIAEKQDRNEITQAQADFEFAQMNTKLASESERRENAEEALRPRMQTCQAFGDRTICY
jgi:hypothetical protein